MAENDKKKFKKKQEKMWRQWIYTHTRGGVGGRTPRGSRAWNNRGTIVEQLQRAWNISTAPPCPDAMPSRCAEMCHQMGVIWAGFGHPPKVCNSPIGKTTVGTPLGVCPTDVVAYSLREYLAHLAHTFRTPNVRARTPCLCGYVRSGGASANVSGH